MLPTQYQSPRPANGHWTPFPTSFLLPFFSSSSFLYPIHLMATSVDSVHLQYFSIIRCSTFRNIWPKFNTFLLSGQSEKPLLRLVDIFTVHWRYMAPSQLKKCESERKRRHFKKYQTFFACFPLKKKMFPNILIILIFFVQTNKHMKRVTLFNGQKCIYVAISLDTSTIYY